MIFAALFCRRRRPKICFFFCVWTLFFAPALLFRLERESEFCCIYLAEFYYNMAAAGGIFFAFWMRFCIKNTFLSAIWRHFLHKTSSNPQKFPPAAGRNFFKPRNLKNFKTQCFSCSQDIGFSCSQLCLRICRGRARTPADQILDYVRPKHQTGTIISSLVFEIRNIQDGMFLTFSQTKNCI